MNRVDVVKGGHVMRRKKLKRKGWIVPILFTLYSSIIFILLYCTIVSAFKSATEISKGIWNLPKALDFQYFAKVIDDGFLRYIVNSLIVAVVGIGGLLLCAGMLSYGHARFQFKGKGLLESYILFGLMFPIQLGVLVNHKIISAIGLSNTLIGLAFIYIGNLSLASFLFMKFFRTLPIELAESAKIDGANEFTIFYKVMVPLSKPVIGTVILVCGLTIYNDLFLPMIFTHGDNRTVTVVIQTTTFNFVRFLDQVFPMVTLNIIPIIVIFIFCERQLVEGLTAGATKG